MADRDTIIRMAREAGFPLMGPERTAAAERFCALVIADFLQRTPPPPMLLKKTDIDPGLLREMQAQAQAQAMPLVQAPGPTQADLDAAVLLEREACRLAARNAVLALPDTDRRSGDLLDHAIDCAIRARNQQGGAAVAEAVAAERRKAAALLVRLGDGYGVRDRGLDQSTYSRMQQTAYEHASAVLSDGARLTALSTSELDELRSTSGKQGGAA